MVRLNKKNIKLNTLYYIRLPGYSFGCFLKISGVTLDTMQGGQMLKHFIGVIGGGIRGVIGNRFGNVSTLALVRTLILTLILTLVIVKTQGTMVEHDQRSMA